MSTSTKTLYSRCQSNHKECLCMDDLQQSAYIYICMYAYIYMYIYIDACVSVREQRRIGEGSWDTQKKVLSLPEKIYMEYLLKSNTQTCLPTYLKCKI